MSKLLGDLLEEQRRGALDYEEFLKKMEELAQKIASGDTSSQGMPERLKSHPFAVAMYNSLASLRGDIFVCPSDPEERATLAMALETAMNKGAPSAWRGVPTRENIIQGLLYPLLDKDEHDARRQKSPWGSVITCAT